MTETQPATMGGNTATRTYTEIAKALAALQPKLPVITKDQKATVKSDKGQYSYSYADLSGIAVQLYPLLAEQGLSFTAGPTIGTASRFVLHWMLLHKSGEYLDGEYPLPMDAKTPQALGSAITYGRRYCLCSVTGVVTDDDDGAAATYSERQQTVEPVDNDRVEAIARVQNAWTTQYGSWNPQEAGAAFGQWSGGEDVRTAPHGRLRSFAAYLSTLPVADAGSDPMQSPPPANGERPPVAPPEDDPLGPRRRKMFALFKEVGLTERQTQLAWITEKLGRTIKSRGELEEADYDLLLKRLQEGDVPAAEVDASPRMAGRGQLRGIDGVFKQLGITDGAERLRIASAVTGRTPVDKDGQPSAAGMYAAEAEELTAALGTCGTRADVEALVRMAEAANATEQGGES